MKIGIPNAMLYYRFGVLWKTFFSSLGCEVVISGETNRKVLTDGANKAIDECCLPAKIFLGHVAALSGECDYVLVPRVKNYGKNAEVCVRFNGLHDIVRNTFPGIRVLGYNLQASGPNQEYMGFLQMGMRLGKQPPQITAAYLKGKHAQSLADKQRHEYAMETLQAAQPKILILAQSYLIHDKLAGEPILKLLKEQGVTPIYAGDFARKDCEKRSQNLSSRLYWKVNKELVGAIGLCGGRIDGIITVTAFPCGSDALVNELILRKVKHLPIINLVVDELQGEAGLETRIESFIDIIKERSGQHASNH